MRIRLLALRPTPKFLPGKPVMMVVPALSLELP
jgi:hypothetical protein